MFAARIFAVALEKLNVSGKSDANISPWSDDIEGHAKKDNPIVQTDADVQGNLLHEYEQKFAEPIEQEKLTKLCSNAVFW